MLASPSPRVEQRYLNKAADLERKRGLQEKLRALLNKSLICNYEISIKKPRVIAAAITIDYELNKLLNFLIRHLKDLDLREKGRHRCPTVFHEIMLIFHLFSKDFPLPQQFYELPLPWNMQYGKDFVLKWKFFLKECNIFDQMTPLWLWLTFHIRSYYSHFNLIAKNNVLDLNVGVGRNNLFSLLSQNTFCCEDHSTYSYLENLFLLLPLSIDFKTLPDKPAGLSQNQVARYEVCRALANIDQVLHALEHDEERKGNEPVPDIKQFDTWIKKAEQFNAAAQEHHLHESSVLISSRYHKLIEWLQKRNYDTFALQQKCFAGVTAIIEAMHELATQYHERRIELAKSLLSELPMVQGISKNDRWDKAYALFKISGWKVKEEDTHYVKMVNLWKMEQLYKPIDDIGQEAADISLMPSQAQDQSLAFLQAYRIERNRADDLAQKLLEMKIKRGHSRNKSVP